MSKNVFHPAEIVNLTAQTVKLKAPVIETQVEELPELDLMEYSGPTADDLRREAEAFRSNWEEEKAAMIADAESQVQEILEKGRQTAFEEVQKKTDEAQKEKIDAQSEAESLRSAAQADVEELRSKSESELVSIEKEAYEKGYQEGKEKGYDQGMEEVQRLVERLHVIISSAVERRSEIINEAETQLIDLVLLISRKVIKVISENQKNVVINNVVQALRKLKSRGDVVIRVNMEDLELTTERTKDFIRMVESVKSITVMEDSAVDRGGCIIETDFGQIDARISSQLHEIEERILELTPITIKGEQ